MQHRTIVAAATTTELKELHRTFFASITTFTRMGSVLFCLFCGGVPTPIEFCVYISFIMRKRENATQNYSCCRNRHGTQRTAQNFPRANHYLHPDGFCAVLSVPVQSPPCGDISSVLKSFNLQGCWMHVDRR